MQSKVNRAGRIEKSGPRKLAAIMFTDIVGFTVLAQTDESQALEVLERHNRFLSPFFPKYQGRKVKSIGDSFLVEFDSGLDAVNCAIDIQKSLHDYNLSSRDEWEIKLRVGIHLGDVVHKDGDIFGDAVNIASRIQPLAEPEGICISDQVFGQVHNKIVYSLDEVEDAELRNVRFQTKVYSVLLPWAEGKRSLVSQSGAGELHPLRIAVLPFSNLSPDPNDEYFADGMTEELISTLSRIRELKVISRTSIMRYKNSEKRIGEIGKELAVGSILEGSVRKASDDLRITVQLIDATNDVHLWSEDYDRKLDNVFAIQKEIALQVSEALKIRLLSIEKKDIERKPTQNTEAYTLYLKGRYFWNERSREGTDKAVKYFVRAIKLDKLFALAYSGLAGCHIIYANYGWRTPRESFALVQEYSLKAIEIDPRLAEAHAALGIVHSNFEYRWSEAESELKRAIELEPSFATSYQWYSLDLRFMGRFEESYEQIKRAYALDPFSRVIGLNVGVSLLAMGRLNDAIEQLKKVIEANPDYAFPHLDLGWTYYLQSRIDEALEEIRKSVALSADDPLYRAELALVLGLIGRSDEANQMAEVLKDISRTTYVSPGRIGIALFGAGRKDEAFTYFEKAYDERSDVILYLNWRPWLKEMHEDPRWREIRSRIGLARRP